MLDGNMEASDAHSHEPKVGVALSALGEYEFLSRVFIVAAKIRVKTRRTTSIGPLQRLPNTPSPTFTLPFSRGIAAGGLLRLAGAMLPYARRGDVATTDRHGLRAPKDVIARSCAADGPRSRTVLGQ